VVPTALATVLGAPRLRRPPHPRVVAGDAPNPLGPPELAEQAQARCLTRDESPIPEEAIVAQASFRGHYTPSGFTL
jgi:hypothetical protein